jgi:DNA-binding NarL/FixJ family response regulator
MEKGASPFRVLIADDHALMMVGTRTVLEREVGIEVVGDAQDGLEALELSRKLRPDLVLMDISMPGMDGIEATRAIKEEHPETIVLMLTAHDDHDLMVEAVVAGAAGYVLKGAGPARLVAAVRDALNGDFALDQGLAMQLVRRLGGGGEGERGGQRQRGAVPPPHNTPPPGPLSPRELEVLAQVVAGKTNRLIAQELHVSLSTVKRHLERVTSKLGVSDRTQAAVKATEMGLVPRPEEG